MKPEKERFMIFLRFILKAGESKKAKQKVSVFCPS
jgi:hypothetical protein